MRLFLASASPRRRQLLALLVDHFDVLASGLIETTPPLEPPAAMVQRLALQKAELAYQSLAAAPRVLVLGGDTAVAVDDVVLGKPTDRHQAQQMLRQLSGRTHQVYSAVALVSHAYTECRLSTSQVTFARLSAQQIQALCQGDEPLDKAGGYGIQSAAGEYVVNLQGSYSGVMGLPLWHTQQLLWAARQNHPTRAE